jgi:hypothetical protein
MSAVAQRCPVHPDPGLALVNLAAAHRRRGEPFRAAGCYARAVGVLVGQVRSDDPTLLAARLGLLHCGLLLTVPA